MNPFNARIVNYELVIIWSIQNPKSKIQNLKLNDDLADTQAKMREYIENGLRLGWLINPQKKQVEIYRLNKDVEVLNFPKNLSGEDILPGFILDLANIF